MINTSNSELDLFKPKFFTALFFAFLFSLLSGCGGSSPREALGNDTNSNSGTTTTTTFGIAFTSATDNTLSIQGAGGTTSTTLTYTVTDSNGAAAAGVEVSFSITDPSSTNAAISASSPISDINGEVTVTIQSSTNAGAINVLGTIVGTADSATSAQITIVGQTADQIAFLTTSSPTLDFLGGSGTTQATITFLVSNTNNAPVSGAGVTFTLNDPQSTSASLVSATGTSAADGTVSVTVNSGTSTGEFTITATIDGSTISDTSPAVRVTDLATDKITFVSTTTDTLAFQGSGGTEQATLVFNVSNQNDVPLQGITVQFSVNDPGGTSISLATTVATSGADGNVTTVVQSGSIPGVFSVVATVNASTFTTSEQIQVSAGLPVQGRLSLSASPLNPANAWDTDGVTVTIQAIVTDALGNPVPDGTEVRFISPESGSIGSSCATANEGTCSVTWRSSSPRPDSGRLSILAYTNGIERFVDVNGNGVYDDGTDTFTLATDDIGEPFNDSLEDDAYNLGEFFLDTNNDLTRNAGDGTWTSSGIVVFQDITIVMADDLIRAYTEAPLAPSPAIGSTIDVTGGPQTVFIALTDSYNPILSPDADNPNNLINPLPLGSTIEFSTSNGTIIGESSFVQANTSVGPTTASILIGSDGTAGFDSSNLLRLQVTTPDGTISVPATWNVID